MYVSAWSTWGVPALSPARHSRAAPAANGSSRCEVRVLAFSAYVHGPAAILRLFRELRPRAPSWTTRCAGAVTATFDVQVDTPRPGSHQLFRDGTLVSVVEPPIDLLSALEAAVNAAAIQALGELYLLVHAGAVAYADRGVLLPAPAGSGKTTLVAALVAAGFQYLSDEVGVFDPRTWQLLPFAKSLSVKRGGARALASVHAELAKDVPHLRSGRELIWYLPPPTAAWPSGPVPLRYIVLPEYVPGARTELVPIGRMPALSRVVQQSYKLQAHGAYGLGGLIEALRTADCYALTVGQLRPAVDQLRELVHG